MEGLAVIVGELLARCRDAADRRDALFRRAQHAPLPLVEEIGQLIVGSKGNGGDAALPPLGEVVGLGLKHKDAVLQFGRDGSHEVLHGDVAQAVAHKEHHVAREHLHQEAGHPSVGDVGAAIVGVDDDHLIGM